MKLATSRRISRPTWGLNLDEMRKLYKRAMLPIISYACPAWFIRAENCRWGLRVGLVRVLERLQYVALLHISGAMKGTASWLLHKEMYIIPIALHLQRRALTHRARKFDQPAEKMMRSIRHAAFPGQIVPPDVSRHPYEVCYYYAQWVDTHAQAWTLARPTGTALGMKRTGWRNWGLRPWEVMRYIRRMIKDICQSQWRDYQKAHKESPSRITPAGAVYQNRILALEGNFTSASLEIYSHCTRANTTLMIQARTGIMPLKGFLHMIKVSFWGPSWKFRLKSFSDMLHA